jgi:hypothetical protein
MVANQLYELCEAVGPEPTRLVLFFIYSDILEFSYTCKAYLDIHGASCYVYVNT